MGLPVTIYRYTDAGAPQLTNGTPSEWMDILKKCLVSGYGTKAGLGWTIEFENAAAYKIAFRNKVADGGSGGYVQFWSATGANAANTNINFKAALSMSALDTYVKPIVGRQINVAANCRYWEIIGTSRGFYLNLHYWPSASGMLMWNSVSSIQYDNCFFIGDIESIVAGDMYCFTIGNSESSSTDNYSSNGIGTSSSLCAFLYAADGSGSSVLHQSPKPYVTSSGLDGGDAEALGINHVMVPLMISLSAPSSTSNTSLVSPYLRGFLPGAYHSNFTGYRTSSWPKDLVRDGVTWCLQRSYTDTRRWIKTGTWYD